MKLLHSTGNAAADAAVGAALELSFPHFSNPILSAYVSGSYGNGYAVPTSDVDLYVIFRDKLTKRDEEEYEKLESRLDAIEPNIDFIPYAKADLIQHGQVEMGKYFVHMWGEPTHLEVPNPLFDRYLHQCMHGPYQAMERTRKAKPYRWPLGFPNDQDSWKGYAWRKMTVNGKECPSIKELVVLTGWMATGLIAWKGKKYVPSKRECPDLCDEVIGGEVAKAFRALTSLCRLKLHYLLPETEADREALRAVLPGALVIENYFLQEYQRFLIAGLNDADPVRARTAVIRLGEIFYPNGDSLAALRNFRPANESQEKAWERSVAQLTQS